MAPANPHSCEFLQALKNQTKDNCFLTALTLVCILPARPPGTVLRLCTRNSRFSPTLILRTTFLPDASWYGTGCSSIEPLRNGAQQRCYGNCAALWMCARRQVTCR